MIEDNIKLQTQLEHDYAIAQQKVVEYSRKYSKHSRVPFVNKKYFNLLSYWDNQMNVLFRELRKVTRENYPERFIQSG